MTDRGKWAAPGAFASVGAETLTMRDAPRRSIVRTVAMLARAWVDDSLGDSAAALTYYGILSVFPCLLFALALFGLFVDAKSVASVVDSVMKSSPRLAADLVRERLISIQQTSSVRLLLVGLAGALVGTTAAVITLIEALNRCYAVRETRSFWRRWGLAMVATLTAGAGMLVAIGVAFVAPLIAARVGGPIAQAVRWIRLPLAGVLVAGLWAFVYWALPNTKTRFRVFTPGALVGAGLWVAASVALAAYVRWSRSYEVTYGALGGVIVILLWMWLSASAVLLGAEVNKLLPMTLPAAPPRTSDFDGAGMVGAALSSKEAPMTMVYEESLSGRSVIDSTGRSIGEVIALVIDTEAWRIEALRVKLHKDVTEEIGASHGAFRAARLDVPTAFIHNVSDAVVLSGPIGTLRTLEQQPSL
jgi:membrane protein